MFIQKYSLCDSRIGVTRADGGDGDDSLTTLKASVAELTAENERMKKHQATLLDETKAAKTALKAFEGIDPTKIKSMMDTLASSEEVKLIAEGKLDDVVAKRTEKIRLDFEAFKESAAATANKLQESNDSYRTKYREEKVSVALIKAAEKSGAHPHAIDDIISRAKGIFSVGEDDTVEARDKEGNLVVAGGKPLDPTIFVEKLKETAPHCWPTSAGHNAQGKSFGKNTPNPFKKGDTYNLTAQAKLTKSSPELAAQMKAAAG